MTPERVAAAAAILALSGGVTVASSATLVAEATDANTLFADFQIGFLDANRNGLVDFTEITSFSGVTQTEADLYPAFQGLLLAIPKIEGISTGGGLPGIDTSANLWIFSAATPAQPQTFGNALGWTYVIAPSPGPIKPPLPPAAPIPLPATAWLLGIGVGWLVALRRLTARDCRIAGRGAAASARRDGRPAAALDCKP